LAIASLIVYAVLTVWNVFTQGKVDTYTSVVYQEFLSSSNISCSPAVLDVGTLLYTSPTGMFNWIVQAVDNGVVGEFATALQYTGSSVTANITSFGLTYAFAQQTYKYGVCANATFNEPLQHSKSLNIAQPNTIVITLCADFDLSTANLPPWTISGQQKIQDRVFGLSQFFQRLSLPNGTFPSDSFPPYGLNVTSPPITDTSITPAKVLDTSMWMGGFKYLPSKDGGTDHDIIRGDSDNVLNITQAFQETYDAGATGFLLALAGIGGLMLKATTGEPAVVTDMREYILSTGNTMMNLASVDLNGRALGTSYLCTLTGSQWKPILSLIAVVLGNNAGMFAGILACLAFVAQLYDERPYKAVDEEKAQIPLLPYTPTYKDGYMPH